MEWSNLGYLVPFGAMAFMMLRGGGCCGGENYAGNNGGHGGGHHNQGSRGGHDGCCGGGSASKAQSSQNAEKHTETHFIVEGMTCQHCAATVEKALLGRQGVTAARVSLEDKKVEVHFDPAVINVETLKKMVREVGYQAE